jgi:hypothetical protein
MSSPTAERNFPAGDGFWRHIPWWYVGGAAVTTAVGFFVLFAIGPFPAGFALLWLPIVAGFERSSRQDEADARAYVETVIAQGVAPADAADEYRRIVGGEARGFWFDRSSGGWRDEARLAVALTLAIFGAGMALLAWRHPETLAPETAPTVLLWSLTTMGAGLVLLLASRWIASRRDRDVAQ